MKIEWLGHACFEITNHAGYTIITDPYDESVGYGVLDRKADLVSISHHHHDHDCLSAIKGDPYVTDSEETVEKFGFTLKAIKSFHDDVSGKKRGMNLIRVIEADGQKVVHLGDLGHSPNEEQLAFIQNADVLLLPVGGFYTIDTQTALSIAEQAKPKCVVPMHFQNEFCRFPISSEETFAAHTQAVYAKEKVLDVSDMLGSVVMKCK